MVSFAPDTPAKAIYTWFGQDMDSQGVIRTVAEGRLTDVLACARALPLDQQADIHVEIGAILDRETFGRSFQNLRDSYPLAEIAFAD